ncbi:hypothetical protein V6N13_040706 [Hibiscus sabdariffa]|uniref:Uncharacterized protein n=1 Tax=Hibiscus sabdariffa TaxID=183260 RepID=A0ABR2R955_9ROSI
MAVKICLSPYTPLRQRERKLTTALLLFEDSRANSRDLLGDGAAQLILYASYSHSKIACTITASKLYKATLEQKFLDQAYKARLVPTLKFLKVNILKVMTESRVL